MLVVIDLELTPTFHNPAQIQTMDLPVDSFGLTEADLGRVFRYATGPQPTTIIRFMDSEKVSACVRIHAT